MWDLVGNPVDRFSHEAQIVGSHEKHLGVALLSFMEK